MLDCPTCRGTKHVRTPEGWRRCDCAEHLLDLLFIKTAIRGQAEHCPEAALQKPPYPLVDLTVGGNLATHARDFQIFKGRLWASLMAYRRQHNEFAYEYMEASRLPRILFREDPEYDALTELRECDLLVLTLGATPEYNNPMGAQSVLDVMIGRQQEQRPTWIYTPFGADVKFRELKYPDALIQLIKPIRNVSYVA